MTAVPASAPARLARFVEDVGSLLTRFSGEAERLRGGRRLLAALVAHDDWLPAAYAVPHPEFYRQYLLHADPRGRFSVVSFVWGPAQGTPIHDHTVWGLVGVLRGAELSQRFTADGVAPPVPVGAPERLEEGAVEAVSPAVGDVHRVRNACERVSVSIHLYGADIGQVRRHVFPAEGGMKPFVSGYANDASAPPFEIVGAAA